MVAKMVPQLEEALALALRLSPVDKVRLVERVVVTLEDDLTAPQSPSAPHLPAITGEEATPSSGAWGANLVALINSLDLSDWEAEDLDDSVAWVKHKRREQDERRTREWNSQ